MDHACGRLVAFKNGNCLGVVVAGLTGELCWAAAMFSEGDSVRIITDKPPPVGWREAVTRQCSVSTPDESSSPTTCVGCRPNLAAKVDSTVTVDKTTPVPDQDGSAGAELTRAVSQRPP
jgi:hypothetical protein